MNEQTKIINNLTVTVKGLDYLIEDDTGHVHEVGMANRRLTPREAYELFHPRPSWDGLIHKNCTLFLPGRIFHAALYTELAVLGITEISDSQEGYRLLYIAHGTQTAYTILWEQRPRLIIADGQVGILPEWGRCVRDLTGSISHKLLSPVIREIDEPRSLKMVSDYLDSEKILWCYM